jgi:nephrocystin-3
MATPSSKVIRVFLSSTFVDFQEERSLLVKQVFPSLRRRARSRGVEIVDVDLRWGVTAEQTERGETLPLCLAEIERCRPYFISLLGERYGWVPPADPTYYQAELLERQPWLKEHMGGASVTELEILHGVLRHPEMAGHACFYLRDPAYAQAQSMPGWVAETPRERQRLEALKDEVRRSGFPVSEGLANPQTIAERIEADLWELIERTFPEQEPPDALEREGRRHADYRRARTGLYLGGETAIDQLERWMADGEQRILITGESGAGKSALIANWLEAHQRSHPQDLVHAHHLGCTNDASAVRPLLGRLIDTASQMLIQEQQISEPLKVPQDWWELVFKVGEVFALISCWIQRHGCRWILVLDGLDRLDQDDQQALPWLPTTLPPGIHIIASALDGPARSILHERAYLTLEIGPLGQGEQQQLIERYLSRYTKQLERGLQQKILAHPLAGSPLFLKVLLEELRQCAGFETLADQLEFYLKADSIDALYAKVLERLEHDGHGEASRQALTALWASRAGLSETELLEITGLAPVQWAPVDLALEEAFGRNGERLVFGHEFGRRAVERRYLPGEADQQGAHSLLADWFEERESWDERVSEECPWQLRQAGRLEELRDLILDVNYLSLLSTDCSNEEVLDYWQAARTEEDFELDDMVAYKVERTIAEYNKNDQRLISFLDDLADLFDAAGLHRSLLLRLRRLALELQDDGSELQKESIVNRTNKLAKTHDCLGSFNEAETLCLKNLEKCKKWLGLDHHLTLAIFNNLGLLYHGKEKFKEAEEYYRRALEGLSRWLSCDHPSTLTTLGNLANLYRDKGEYDHSEALYQRCIEARARIFGHEHLTLLITQGNLANLYYKMGQRRKSKTLYLRTLESMKRLLGPEHRFTLITVNNLAALYNNMGEYAEAEALYLRCLDGFDRVLGHEHPDTHVTIYSLADLLSTQGRHTEAIPLRRRELAWCRQQNGDQDSSTLLSINQLAIDLRETNAHKEAETLFHELLTHSQLVLEPGDFDIGRALSGLAKTLEAAGKLDEALIYAQKCLDHRMEHQGPDDFYTNRNRLDLARVLHKLGQFAEASAQLDALLASLSTVEMLDESDQQLQAEAKELREAITRIN